MGIQAASRFFLLGVVCVVLGPPAIHAQLPRRLERCLPYPTFAEEIEGANQEPLQPRVIIDRVEFDGPNHLPPSVRRRLIRSLRRHKFNGDSNWVGELEEVGIRGAWQDEGYFNAKAKVKARVISSDSTQEHVSITVHVDEGVQYRLEGIQFRSSDPEHTPVFPPDQLRKAIPMRDGELFNVSKIREGLDALRKLYGSKGYIDFTAEPLMDFDDARQRVSLVLELDEQMQFRVGKIEILGLDPKTETLLRSKLKPGDPFDFQVLEDFYKENKSVLPADASPADDEVIRKVNVKEATVDLVFDFRTCSPLPD